MIVLIPSPLTDAPVVPWYRRFTFEQVDDDQRPNAARIACSACASPTFGTPLVCMYTSTVELAQRTRSVSAVLG